MNEKALQAKQDAVKTIQKFGVYPVLTFRLNGRLF